MLGIACAQVGREPREPRAERKGLHPAPRTDCGVEEEQQRPGVRLHRARDVAEDDELARHRLAVAERPVDGVATGAEALPQQPAHVAAENRDRLRGLDSLDGRGAALVVEHRQLAEDLSRAEGGERD